MAGNCVSLTRKVSEGMQKSNYSVIKWHVSVTGNRSEVVAVETGPPRACNNIDLLAYDA